MTDTTAPAGELDVPALSGWMEDRVSGGLAAPLTATLIAGGRSNPTYELSDGTRQWILRRPPYGEILQSAHDMAREATVMSALADSAVPVPHVVGLCRDPELLGAEFYVMDKLHGRTLRTAEDTASLTPQQRGALADTMIRNLVTLHEIDPADVGLGDWGRSQGYLERQLNRWERQWHAIKTSERPEVDEVIGMLRRSLPETRFPGIVHGDYKIDNLLVGSEDRTRILGVLDWEMSTLGDTLADLGMLVSFWDERGKFHNPITAGATALEGFPTPDEVVRQYADLRGISIESLDWYIIFADLKLAVILEQIHARHLAGTTVGDWYDDIGGMVGPILDRSHDRALHAGL